MLSGSCLNLHVPNLATLHWEVASCAANRNRQDANINWRFTTDDAHMKLKDMQGPSKLERTIQTERRPSQGLDKRSAIVP